MSDDRQPAGGAPPGRSRRVCVVGSGTAFLSGISYYTYYLARALSARHTVSVVLMRHLIPARWYPGRDRVDAQLADLDTGSFAATFDGVDWTGIPSVPRAVWFLWSQRPDVVVFQWWTGAVLPWYLVLAATSRLRGARVVVEFHEDLDTGEAAIPFIRSAVLAGVRLLTSMSAAYVVHSGFDVERLTATLGLPRDRIAVVPHGPYPLSAPAASASDRGPTTAPARSDPGPPTVTILFFGTIRPYKGLEYLVEAFERLPRDIEDARRWRLLVVGETWEGWLQPLQMIEQSPFADDIRLINRYVDDTEVGQYFAEADIVALPYLRSSASGPLHLTMAQGLPVVITEVGGLIEAAGDYQGTVFVPARDAAGLADGLVRAATLVGSKFPDPQSWDRSAQLYGALFDRLFGPDAGPGPGPGPGPGRILSP